MDGGSRGRGQLETCAKLRGRRTGEDGRRGSELPDANPPACAMFTRKYLYQWDRTDQAARQLAISLRPSPRLCSKSRTKCRECSNSWMSAQTSARQGSSWIADSPQVAQRVCRLERMGITAAPVPGSSMKTQRTSWISSSSP